MKMPRFSEGFATAKSVRKFSEGRRQCPQNTCSKSTILLNQLLCVIVISCSFEAPSKTLKPQAVRIEPTSSG